VKYNLMSEDQLLRVESISKRFGGVVALNDVSFEVRKGEIIGLIGENGSGKSTMIKILAGVYVPDKGDIYIDHRHYKRLNPIQSIKEGINVIYQDFSLFSNLTVAENVAVSSLISEGKRLVNWQELYHIAEKNLHRIKARIPLDAEVQDLSTAERQIVAIARTLVHGARFIIMDEPTTALTRQEVQSLFEVIRQLKDQGISVLFVSHKLHEVKEIADRTIVFRDGRKVLDQSMEKLDLKTMEFYMTGRRVKTPSSVFTKMKESHSPLLQVKNLTLLPYFSNVSFCVKQREVLGITGLLGSGQRELVLSLFGVLPAESGEIYFEGKKIQIRSIQDAMRHGIGYVPEDRVNEGVFSKQSVANNVVAAIVDYIATKFGVLKRETGLKVCQRWIKELNIKTPSPETPVESLSGGNQQRVVIAKWLADDKLKLLILNGPTVGIDVVSKADIHKLIRNMTKEKNLGIILVSDDIPELLQTCDRILLMRDGKIAAQFEYGEIDEEGLYRQMIEENVMEGA